MSTPDRLAALLADYAPPPVPAGLAGRVADAALAMPQAPALPGATARRGRGGRDRRGRWLRRPLVAGGIALGLAFSGAVAATLAGVEVALPPKVQTVLAEVPFFGQMAKAEPPSAPAATPAPVRRNTPAAAAAPSEAPPAAADPDPLLRMQRARAVRRWLMARQIVAERRAAGLPTPRADRIEEVIERRLVRQGVLPADPVERAEVREEARRVWRARVEARQAARRARFAEQGMLPPPAVGDLSGPAAETEALDRMQLREARAERMRMRRAMRLERMRRWRERREQLQLFPPDAELAPAEPTEGPDTPPR